MVGTEGVALVTGSAQRIGAAIAERLARAGFGVVLHSSARSEPQARALAERLRDAGAQAAVVVADLSRIADCDALIAAAAALGPLRLLVNNAAVFEDDGFDRFEADRWDRHFAINLRAPTILSQRFAEQARPADDPSIVNLLDQRVLRPDPRHFSYTLSKAALWTATRTMAQGFAERGIRVNAVGPGPVLPNSLDGEAGFTREVEGVPLARAVSPADVAEAVLYLARAKAVTGQMVAVDAGQHLGWRTPDVVGPEA